MCQHCKSLLLDERVLLDTSSNLTENGLTRNIEFLDVIEYRPFAEDFERMFDYWWEKAREVTPTDIGRMERGRLARHKPLSRSVSRSLSSELTEAEDKKEVEGQKSEPSF